MPPGGHSGRNPEARAEIAQQAGAGGASGGQQDHGGNRLQPAAGGRVHPFSGKGGLLCGVGGAADARSGSAPACPAGTQGGLASGSHRKRHGTVPLHGLDPAPAGSDAGLRGKAAAAPAQSGGRGIAPGHCPASDGLSGDAGRPGKHSHRRGNGFSVQPADSAAGPGSGLCRGGAGLQQNPENLCRRRGALHQRSHGRSGG